MIQFNHVTVQYQKDQPILTDMNLSIQRGVFGLLGPNGSGKSTFLRLLATLIRPRSGHVLINGLDVQLHTEQIRKSLGYMPQSFQAEASISGRELLDFVAQAKGVIDPVRRNKQVEQKLEEVGLLDRADHRIKTYSNGMLQRLGIAQALIGDPSVLILDEPTSGLDPDERTYFRTLFNRYGKHATVILSTHIFADIEYCCEYLSVLNLGKVCYHGRSAELADYAQGRVWNALLSDEQFVLLRTEKLVSAEKQEGGVMCRLISEQSPMNGAQQAEPTIEDGYLALIGGGQYG